MVHPIDTYATAVTTGLVPAGKYHRLACARHLRDRAREHTPAFPYRFDVAKAERFLRFGERLKHYKGQWAGSFIEWEPHQVFRLGSLFGWIHAESGLRRFRHSYNELPRKNGKSLEAAVVSLYVTFFDDPMEPGAEGYCAATKRDQAKIVFNDAKRLVVSSGLRTRIEVLTTNLSRMETAAKLEPLGADEDSTDGLNAHIVTLDELHAFKRRGMIDVLETATAARLQPILFKITTAGDDPLTPCGDEHLYATQVLDETLQDDHYFAFIAHADTEDDWTAESTARKANPNYGISVSPDDLMAKVTKAKGMPAAAAAYKQKHLNLWVNTYQPWLSMDGWRGGQSPPEAWTEEDLRDEPCYVGIDLASKLDLCAMVAVFPPSETHARTRLLRWVWTPLDTLKERAHRDRAPYERWVDEHYLIAEPGTQINHQSLREALVTLRELADIVRIGFDPWHAGPLIHQLVDEDAFAPETVIEVGQTYRMSIGCKALEGEVLAGAVDARGCPLMEWTFANTVVQRDGKDNIYPVKKRSRGRIDPCVAACIAWNLLVKEVTHVPAEDPDLVVA